MNINLCILLINFRYSGTPYQIKVRINHIPILSAWIVSLAGSSNTVIILAITWSIDRTIDAATFLRLSADILVHVLSWSLATRLLPQVTTFYSRVQHCYVKTFCGKVHYVRSTFMSYILWKAWGTTVRTVSKYGNKHVVKEAYLWFCWVENEYNS